jgi:hypothetical protein
MDLETEKEIEVEIEVEAQYLQRSYGILVWDGLQVLVQVVDQRSACGDVQLCDDVIRDIVQIFHCKQ